MKKHTQEIATLSHQLLAYILLLACLLVGLPLDAEGIRQLAPTQDDSPVMLDIDRDAFGNFAAVNGPAASRLYVTIGDANEVMYIGLSSEVNFKGEILNNSLANQYTFQIRQDIGLDDLNPIVHGPFNLDQNRFNIDSFPQAEFGMYSVDATTSGGDSIFVFRPGIAGDFYIEFSDNNSNEPNETSNSLYIPLWDFTVVDILGVVQDGRLWSRNWAFRTPTLPEETPDECVWDRPFNGEIYTYTEDGFVSKIDFQDSGMQGLSFNLTFNSRGPGNTGDLGMDRMSIPGVNATQNSAFHQIFLNEPDEGLFPSGECGEISTSSSFECTGNNEYCLDVMVDRAGQVEIILDFDRNGMLDDSSQDLTLVVEFTDSTLTQCVPWNGIRGDGTTADSGDTINLIFIYAQGIQHWSVFDLEFIKNGYCVETVRPVCPDSEDVSRDLYWDDRNIPEDPGTGAVKDGRAGCPCESGCRTWNFFEVGGNCNNFDDDDTEGYGDKSTINTWWFANSRQVFTADIPLVSIGIDGLDSICLGDTTTFMTDATSTSGMVTYLWSGPGVDGDSTANVDVSEPGEYCVTVTDELNCTATVCKTLTVVDLTDEISDYPDTVQACPGEEIMLMPDMVVADATYSWSPAADLDGADTATPSLTVPEEGSNTYVVTITQGDLGCIFTDTVVVDPFPAVVADFTFSSLCVDTQLDFVNNSSNADSVFWDFGDLATDTDTSSLADPTYFYPSPGIYTVTLIAFSEDGCVDSTQVDVVVVENSPINISADVNGQLVDPLISDLGSEANPVITCEPEVVITPTPGPGLDFVYVDENGDTLGMGDMVTVDLSGEIIVTVIATDSLGCTNELPISIAGGPVDISVPDTIVGCLPAIINLPVTNNDPNDTLTFMWEPSDLVDDPTSGSPNFTGPSGEYELVVTATNQFGCEGSDTVQVLVLNETDTLGFTAQVDCDGQTVIFTNTSTVGFGYLWDFGDGNTSTEINPVHVYDSSGTYTVTLDTEFDQDCIEPFSMDVTVQELQLEADLTAELGECLDGAAIINFMDNSINNTGQPLTYMWTFNPGDPSMSEEQNPDVTVTESGPVEVTLTVMSANGCESTIDTVITVSIPDVDPPTTIVLCPGDTTGLNPNGTSDLIYDWTGPGGFMSDEANPMITEPGEYIVTAQSDTADLNCTDMDTVLVEEGYVPDPIIIGPDGPTDINNDGTITIVDPGLPDGGRGFFMMDTIAVPYLQTCGETVTLEAEDTDPNTTFTWTVFPDGTETSEENPIDFNVQPNDTLLVLLTATSEDGCINYDTVAIVSAEIIADPVPGDMVSLCLGQDTTLAVEVSGNTDGVTYEWTGEPIIGPTDGPSIQITAIDEGTFVYQAVVTNAAGCTDTVEIIVDVLPFVPNEYPDTVFACFGEPTVISGGALVDGYIYDWDPDDGVDLSDPANPVVVVSEDGIFTVTITDPVTGCFETDTVFVEVGPEIGIEIDPMDTILCELDSVTLTATTTLDGTEISWYDDEELDNQIGTGSVLVYTATEAGTVTIFALGEDPETGCTDTAMATIEVIPFEPNDYPDSIFACFGEPTPIGGEPTVDGYIYEWSPMDGLDLSDPDNPIVMVMGDATYTVTITDPDTDCFTVDTIVVTSGPEIGLEVDPADTVLCEPGLVDLTATTVLDGAEIVWYDDEALSNEIGTGTELTFDANEEGAFTIFALATDPVSGCTDTASAVITVDPLDDGLPAASVNTCAGDEVTFDLFPGGLNPSYIYTYEPADLVSDDGFYIGTDDTTIIVTILDPATGCEVIDTVDVTYTDLTGLTIVSSADTVFIPADVEITVLGCDDCEYDWMTDNGTIDPADDDTVTGMPEIGGTAEDPETVTYGVIVSQDGCFTELTLTVFVVDAICDIDHVYLPNAFSPNGDNMNDVLKVRSNFLDEISEFDLMIFNRWGQEMYRSFDQFGEWDGTFEGEALEPDTYGYYLRLVCPTGEELIQQGNITILK
ncbi:MAG: PKD domain-containing protein [Bacteroidota bacterium]